MGGRRPASPEANEEPGGSIQLGGVHLRQSAVAFAWMIASCALRVDHRDVFHLGELA
jgi:hypothetical protein